MSCSWRGLVDSMKPELLKLAQDLGITQAQLAKLRTQYARKHKKEAEERLLSWLELTWQETRDRHRFLAKQDGRYHPPQYVSSVEGAIDEAEVVPDDYQTVLVIEAKERFVSHRREIDAQKEALKDLQAVQAEIRQLVQRAVKMGIQPSTVLAPIAREIQAQHGELKDVA